MRLITYPGELLLEWGLNYKADSCSRNKVAFWTTLYCPHTHLSVVAATTRVAGERWRAMHSRMSVECLQGAEGSATLVTLLLCLTHMHLCKEICHGRYTLQPTRQDEGYPFRKNICATEINHGNATAAMCKRIKKLYSYLRCAAVTLHTYCDEVVLKVNHL